MLLSVVVPLSRGRFGARLNNCLAAVRQPKPKVEVEVILSLLHAKGDHAQADIEELRGLGHRLVVTENPHDAWCPGLSRNAGFRAARGDVLASLDADAIIHPRALDLAADHGRAGRAVRCPTIMRPEGIQWWGYRDRARFEEVCDGPVGSGPGSFIAAPRAAVERLRGWDEEYLGYGSCDHDWIARLRQIGCPVVDIAETAGAYALHQHHARQVPKDVLPFVMRNRERFALTEKRQLPPTRNPAGWGGKV